MDRYWFFTWRTYGTWLPGQDGFVGFYFTDDGQRIIEREPGQPTAEPIPALARYAASIMSGEPRVLTQSQAACIFEQLHETARFRGRAIDAIAIKNNHIHIVFGTPGDPDPDRMLTDWKAYASRALNRQLGITKPEDNPEWWVRDGSKRILATTLARAAAIRYVRDQENPLVVWLSEEAKLLVAEYFPDEGLTGEPRP